MFPLAAIFQFNDYERDRFVREIAEKVPAGARVLDAGAGSCRYKPLFGHCRYEAQDFGRYTGPEHQYGELDYVCDITSIPVSEESFDLVLCTEVLEHVPYPERAVAELARILKPGGTLVITAPMMSGIHMAPYHYYGGFSPHWYEHFLPPLGLEVRECRPNGGFFKFYGQESRRFLHVLTPQSTLARWIFFPVKVILALWFRLLVPIACFFLDRKDKEPELTVGYFVTARKAAHSPSGERSIGVHGDV